MSNDEPAPASYSPVWSPDPRTWPPRTGAEREMLTAYLDFHRGTFELECAGVPPERLADRSIPPSSMSLHGILRHLAGGAVSPLRSTPDRGFRARIPRE
jgi:Protein of unknown function (DUF664)